MCLLCETAKNGVFLESVLILANLSSTNKLKVFFEQEGIVVLDWPAKSPDLTPVEKLWGLLKVWIQKKTQKIYRKSTNWLFKRLLPCVQKIIAKRCTILCQEGFQW